MAARLEMPPARMEGNFRRIAEALPRHLERRLHCSLEAIGVEREPGGTSILDIFQHLPRPLADGGGRAQIGEGGVVHGWGRATPVARSSSRQAKTRDWSRAPPASLIEAPPLGFHQIGRPGLGRAEVAGG